MSQQEKVHIIGGGVAGYSTAIAFLNNGFKVHIWEKEATPFTFSSSRNSAIARSYEADPAISYILKQSLFLMSKPQYKMLNPIGLLIKPLEYDYQEDIFLNKHPQEPKAECLRSKEDTLTLPDGNKFSGLLLSGNGVLNLENIHHYLKKKASQAKQFYYKEIKELKHKNNHIRQIILQTPDFKKHIISLKSKDILVNAAGSWAREIMERNNISTPSLKPHKRHMFLLKNSKNWFENYPVIWDEVEDFYIKYHYGDLLVSHCDDQISEPHDYITDSYQIKKFKDTLKTKFVFLQDCPIIKVWSCLRTFTLDNRPIIGFDPSLKNLFWCAGWGGRGMSMSLGMVEIIQQLIKKGYPKKKESEDTNPFSVFRFM